MVLVVVFIAMVAAYVGTSGRQQSTQTTAAGAACPTGAQAGSGPPAKTEELGKSGAKLDIIAVVPVAHGCHATSIAELKKAYQSHPNDIHLTIVDLQGPDAPKYAKKVGATFTRITVNGKYQFRLGGRKVALEKAENMTYRPSDLGPIIGAELKK